MTGQTKETSERVAKMVKTKSERQTGKTKETSELVRKIAKAKEKLTDGQGEMIVNMIDDSGLKWKNVHLAFLEWGFDISRNTIKRTYDRVKERGVL